MFPAAVVCHKKDDTWSGFFWRVPLCQLGVVPEMSWYRSLNIMLVEEGFEFELNS